MVESKLREIEKCTVIRGNIHEYLGMTLEFSVKGKVKVRMDDYTENIIQAFSQKLKSTDMAITPAGDNIFENGNGNPLAKSQAEDFHTMVVKALFYQK